MKKKIAIFSILIFFMKSQANNCPCDSENLIGIKVPNLEIIDKDKYNKLINDLYECHNYRRTLGVHINYCKDKTYNIIKEKPDLIEIEKDYMLRMDTLCYDHLDQVGFIKDSCNNCYKKGTYLPNAQFDKSWPAKAFIMPGCGLMVLGTAATIFTIYYTDYAFNEYKNNQDFVGDFAEFGVKIGSIICILGSGILDIGGSAILSMGIVRIRINKDKENQKSILLRIQ